MPFNLGGPELVFVLVIVLIVFVTIQVGLIFVTYYSETRMARESARWLAIRSAKTQDLAVAESLQLFSLQGIAEQLGPAPGIVDLIPLRQLNYLMSVATRLHAVV